MAHGGCGGRDGDGSSTLVGDEWTQEALSVHSHRPSVCTRHGGVDEKWLE